MTYSHKHQKPDPRVSGLPFNLHLRRARLCSAALFLGAVLTGPVVAQQILPLPGENLLYGKEATFSVAPTCSHCDDGDKTDLTDGKLWQSDGGTNFWDHKGSVGWELGSLPGVMIRFDLGTVQPIQTLGLHTASGRPRRQNSNRRTGLRIGRR